MNRKNVNSYKSVYIHQTGEYFSSIKEANEALGFKLSNTNWPEWIHQLQVEIFYPPKVCYRCKIPLTNENSYKNNKTFLCKSCISKKAKETRKRHPDAKRNTEYKRSYGITVDDYNKMFEEQHGCCAICGKPETKKNQFGVVRLSVDHNHITGKVRGLLCNNCNRALGLLFVDNNKEIIEKIKIYLEN